jgi:hypothetical protein
MTTGEALILVGLAIGLGLLALLVIYAWIKMEDHLP